jgi:hypothetical protein
MALPNRNGLEMVHLQAHTLDISTSGAPRCYAAIVSPVRGRLVRVKAAPYAVSSGTGGTVQINAVAVSGATFAFVSGGGGGTVYSANTTNSPLVQQGDVIGFFSDAAGADGTVACTFQASIRKV